MDGVLRSGVRLSLHNTTGFQNSTTTSTHLEAGSIGSTELDTPNFKGEFDLAEQPLTLNLFHTVQNTEENYQIKLAIKRALMSSDCDPGIKRKIFENIMNIEKNSQDERRERTETAVDQDYLMTINLLLDEIRESGSRIILDHTDFTSVNIKNLDLTNASAVSVKFICMKMDHVIWKNVDFCAARFRTSEINDCHFINVIFNAAVFMKSSFKRGLFDNVSIVKSQFYETAFQQVLVPKVKTDDAQLLEKIVQSETRDLTTIVPESVPNDRSELDLRDLDRQSKLNSSSYRFAQILNFRHTSFTSQNRSLLVLRTTLTVCDVVPVFPITVAELVSQYACEDDWWAQQPLKTDLRTVLDTENNRTIKSAIKKALVSRVCEPKIKRDIFKNMMDFSEQLRSVAISGPSLSEKEKRGENSYIQVINEMLAEIRESGEEINLDHTDFTGIKLAHLNLTDASALSARFKSTVMEYVVWRNGNFIGAQFNDARILQCRFKDSVFNKSTHCRTYFYLTELTNVEMFGVAFHAAKFDGVFVNRLRTDDFDFDEIIVDSILTVRSLIRTYPDVEFYKKNLNACLIIQYSKEENTDSVNFLAREFTTRTKIS